MTPKQRALRDEAVQKITNDDLIHTIPAAARAGHDFALERTKVLGDALEFIAQYPEWDKYYNSSGPVNMQIKARAALAEWRGSD